MNPNLSNVHCGHSAVDPIGAWMDVKQYQQNVAELVRAIVRELDPDQLDVLPALSQRFFASSSVRRRVVRSVFHDRRPAAPSIFGPDVPAPIAQVVLVVVNGVATELLAGTARDRLTGVVGWWRRRRLRKALSLHCPPAGAQATIGQYPAADARRIAEVAHLIALRAGVGPQNAELLAALLAYALAEPAVEG